MGLCIGLPIPPTMPQGAADTFIADVFSGHRPALDGGLCGTAIQLGSQAQAAGGLLIGGDAEIEGGAGNGGG